MGVHNLAGFPLNIETIVSVLLCMDLDSASLYNAKRSESEQMERYRLSFTFGSLLIQETQVIAYEYVKDHDWAAVKSRILDKNLLQKTRLTSSKRYFREIKERLSSAHDWEVDLIASELPYNQKTTVILAITTRYYRFLRDFIIEVIRHKWLGKDVQLQDYDFVSFFESKVPNHEELTEISDTTKAKLRAVTLRTLREGNLLARNRRDIQKLTVPASLLQRYASSKDYDALRIFLLSDKEIAGVSS